MGEECARGWAWLGGLVPQRHACLDECLTPFAAIACGARADDIFPHVLAAAIARNDVINRKMVRLCAAVLAGEIVATKDGAARQFDAWTRSLDLVREANHRRARESRRRGRNVAATVQNDFGSAADEEHNRAVRVAHVQRLVVLVENENVLPHGGLKYSTN